MAGGAAVDVDELAVLAGEYLALDVLTSQEGRSADGARLARWHFSGLGGSFPRVSDPFPADNEEEKRGNQ